MEESMIDRAVAVKDSFESKLMSLPGVIGVGVELSDRGDPFIALHLSSKKYKNGKRLPKRLSGIPVRVDIWGTVIAATTQDGKGDSLPFYTRLRQRLFGR